MTLLRKLDQMTARLIGTVDAGACIIQIGCCCKPGTHRRYDCFGNCVAASTCTPISDQRCQ